MKVPAEVEATFFDGMLAEKERDGCSFFSLEDKTLITLYMSEYMSKRFSIAALWLGFVRKWSFAILYQIGKLDIDSP